MVASEHAELVAAVATEEPRPAAVRKRSLAFGLLLLIGGLALTWIAVSPLGDLGGTLKVPLVLIGVAATFSGVGRVAQRIWGPYFDTGFWLCTLWILALSLSAMFADLLPLGEHKDTVRTLTEPRLARPDLFSSRPLGTNNFSLDLLAQCIYGARVSLLTAIFAVAISMVVGGTIGMLAGYYRGPADVTVGVLTDSVLAFPPLILLIAFATVFGRPTSVSSAILKTGIALAIVGIPTMVRLARANTLSFAQREFVLASRGMGATDRRIVFRELLPNVMLPIVSYAFLIVAVLIIAEGSLSFLNLGLQQPEPTWGNMIAQAGFSSLRDDPHIALVPGVFMFLTVYSFNRIGERARSVWDARESKL